MLQYCEATHFLQCKRICIMVTFFSTGHPIAEDVDVQVYCNNQMIAHAPFSFYQGTNYDVGQMLQLINQYMPQFFTPGYNPNAMGGNSQTGQEGFSQGTSLVYVP